MTWLTPGYGGRAVTGLALLVMAAAIAAGAGAVRTRPGNGPHPALRRRGRRRRGRRAGRGPPTVVPGLLLAFPLAIAGLLVVSRQTVRTEAARIAAGVRVLFVAAVHRHPVPKGGGGEWGGRYFALAIPWPCRSCCSPCGSQGRTGPAGGPTARCGPGRVLDRPVGDMGVGALRAAHRASARLVAAADRAGRRAPGRPDHGDHRGLRAALRLVTFDRQRWLLAEPEGVEDLFGRLRAVGRRGWDSSPATSPGTGPPSTGPASRSSATTRRSASGAGTCWSWGSADSRHGADDRAVRTAGAGSSVGPAAVARSKAIARRLWGARVGWHLLALAIVLLALVPVVGTSSSFSSDEGAGIIQARSLASGDGWIVRPPMPAVDPEGEWYPLISAEQGTKGFAPLAKHPAYSVLLAAGYRAGGVPAMVALSVLGTVAAAGFAAAIARRLDPVLARPCLWVVGLVSPLFFDSFLVMGHTIGAAFAAGAVLFAIRAVTERRPALAAGRGSDASSGGSWCGAKP